MSKNRTGVSVSILKSSGYLWRICSATWKPSANSLSPPRVGTWEMHIRICTCKGKESKSELHDDVIEWKHFLRYWIFVRGIHRWPVDSHHKGHWRGALMFYLICAWTNGWANKPSRLRWFRTPSCSLWRHCNVIEDVCASSGYQGQGQVITSHKYDGIQLLAPVVNIYFCPHQSAGHVVRQPNVGVYKLTSHF